MTTPTGYTFLYNGVEKDFADVFDTSAPGNVITGNKSEAYGGLDLGQIFTPTTGGTVKTFYEDSTNTDLGSIFTPIPLPPGSLVVGNTVANMNTTGMNLIWVERDDDGAYLVFTGMDFYFFGINYGNSTRSIYITVNNTFGFGDPAIEPYNWPVNKPAILFNFFDNVTLQTYVSPPQNGTISSIKYVRIVAESVDYLSYNSGVRTVNNSYEIYYIRDNFFQYMQFNCNKVDFDRTQYNTHSSGIANISNITNGTAFQNTFGAFGNQPLNTEGPQTGGSYVIRSDLNGNNWEFFPNYHFIL